MRRLTLSIGVTLALVAWHPFPGPRALSGQVRATTVAPATPAGVRDWDNTVNRMLRARELEVRLRRDDVLIPGRVVEHLDQFYNGVRVWGGGVSRQMEGDTAISVFGTLYADIAIDLTPALSADEAKAAIERLGGAPMGPGRIPELAVLPSDDGVFRLVWVGAVLTRRDLVRFIIDANTGRVVTRYGLLQRQAANAVIGHGFGVLGDDKKVSATRFAGGFIASDPLRPPAIVTYDMRGNLDRLINVLDGVVRLTASDIASTSSNDWRDAAVVDAHVYAALTYDYYCKRFGRRGLDNANRPLINLVHPVNRSDIFTAPDDAFPYYLNAFYCGECAGGVMVFGEGLPGGIFLESGQRFDFLAGALDVVAHELTHGVTDFTSRLDYVNESGALNEAFSDMMGTSVEFFFQPAGTGLMKADYLLGEDVIRGVFLGIPDGIRSMENPALFGDPDHYSKRALLPPDDEHDNGGVHINSGIPNHAFYLAIEGGVNRTSGVRVQGVGPSNREQIEKVFYRAFTQLMPSNANFSIARAVTLRAAQDLYPANSAPFNAVRDAWTAVGVN